MTTDKGERITIRLETAEMKAMLKALAKLNAARAGQGQKPLSVSDLVRRAIADMLERK